MVKPTKALTLITLFAALAACDSKNESTADAQNPGAAANETIGADAGDGKIGIAECDKYIEAYKACVQKAPTQARSGMEKGLELTIEAWKKAEKGHEEALASSCKSTYDMSAESMKGLGCDW